MGEYLNDHYYFKNIIITNLDVELYGSLWMEDCKSYNSRIVVNDNSFYAKNCFFYGDGGKAIDFEAILNTIQIVGCTFSGYGHIDEDYQIEEACIVIYAFDGSDQRVNESNTNIQIIGNTFLNNKGRHIVHHCSQNISDQYKSPI